MDAKLILLILNGLTQASILFVLGSGLTLAFGLIRVVNLGHGAFYLLGGYIGYSTRIDDPHQLHQHRPGHLYQLRLQGFRLRSFSQTKRTLKVYLFLHPIP